ncbi:MAG: glucuronate isomerase [Ruminococcaceae bacterium]|nr:glucuronate isomerase [Oscillospiraceae bacterium]
MKEFMGKDFLLSNPTAEKLYFSFAENQPIIDYHCHVSPKEIYEDKRFDNLFGVWLSGDHYKWRIMRSNGVDERYITGDAPEKEKFLKFAEALPKAIGNPMYHWCHLELKKYFGYEGVLNAETAEEVWELANKKLAEPDMTVRGIIKKSNVCFIGTTDDPVDSLEWHLKLKEDSTFDVTVAPTFRPDKAFNIEKSGWREYIKILSEISDTVIDSVSALKSALLKRIEFFDKCGCRASDHGLDYMVYKAVPCEETERIMKKALSGETVTAAEAEAFKTELLLFCAAEYSKRGWVMQLHYNCLRNPNSKMFEALGPDTGFDCIGPKESCAALSMLLDALYRTSSLPKTVIYSLDAADNAFIDTLIGAFQGPEVAGKLQHGSAWWFNDNKTGMQEQLLSLANLSLLGNFVGMLTDSRSFLSYTRHEYFRRILCDVIGSLVENGEYPNDDKALGSIVKGICYENAKRYFNI